MGFYATGMEFQLRKCIRLYLSNDGYVWILEPSNKILSITKWMLLTQVVYPYQIFLITLNYQGFAAAWVVKDV